MPKMPKLPLDGVRIRAATFSPVHAAGAQHACGPSVAGVKQVKHAARVVEVAVPVKAARDGLRAAALRSLEIAGDGADQMPKSAFRQRHGHHFGVGIDQLRRASEAGHVHDRRRRG